MVFRCKYKYTQSIYTMPGKFLDVTHMMSWDFQPCDVTSGSVLGITRQVLLEQKGGTEEVGGFTWRAKMVWLCLG